MSIKKTLDYEEAAEVVQMHGWACKSCGRFYGNNEHSARYCCAQTLPCPCGGRRERGWTICASCRDKDNLDKWLAT